jgi:putative acetyltransferase
VSAFCIRRWREADTDELADLFRHSVREVASRDYRPAQVEAWAAGPIDFSERLGKRVSFVAEEAEGRLIGFIQYDPPDRVDMTYVHPEFQRRGVASALLAELEREARDRGARVLHVEASITGRPFFEARGFAVLTPQIVTTRGQDFLNYRMMKLSS